MAGGLEKLSGFLKTINEVVKVEKGEGQDDNIAKFVSIGVSLDYAHEDVAVVSFFNGLC